MRGGCLSGRLNPRKSASENEGKGVIRCEGVAGSSGECGFTREAAKEDSESAIVPATDDGEGQRTDLEREDLLVEQTLELFATDRVLLEIKVEEGRVERGRDGLIVGVICEPKSGLAFERLSAH